MAAGGGGGDSYDDDGNFEDYVITTTDPGPYIIVGTILFCAILYCLLPCIIAMCNRLDQRRRDHSAYRVDEVIAASRTNGAASAANGDAAAIAAATNEDTASSSCAKNSKNASSAVRMTHLQSGRYNAHNNNGGLDKDKDGTDDDVSVGDHRSVASSRSSISSFLSIVLDGAPHGGPTARRQRNLVQRRLQMLETQDRDGGGDDDDESVTGGTSSPTSLFGLEGDAASRAGGGSIRSHSILSSSKFGGGGANTTVDDISIRPSVAPTRDDPRGDYDDDEDEEELHRRYHPSWWVRTRLGRSLDKFLAIIDWDLESKKLIKLGFPFVVQAMLVGGAEMARVAIIGRLMSTRDLSAFVIVDLFVFLTAETLGGFQESLVTLCSQAIGVDNDHLAGQYFQMSVIFYTLLFIPSIVVWLLCIEPLLLLLGYDAETALIGKEFTFTFIWSLLLYGVTQAIYNLLDVIGQENFCTVFVALQEVAKTIALLVAALVSSPSLADVGIIFTVADIVGLIITAIVIAWKGWFAPYRSGIFGSFSLTNKKAVCLFVKTSAALSFGYILTYGEWEILTLFASFLGPAEVATWGILGAIWEPLEEVTLAVGDAAEVRCAYLLGCGKPEKAKISSYKSLVLGFALSLFITSCIYIASDDLARWLTTDPTLQRLLADLTPLFGLGNVVLTVGSLSWTLIGAQGRYRLATAVGFAGSWLVTTPLAAVMSIVLRVNLQGQTAALVAGYMFSGTIQSFLLFRSDWGKLSEIVIEQNAQNELEDDEDSSDDGNSSEGSSSSGPESDSRYGGMPGQIWSGAASDTAVRNRKREQQQRSDSGSLHSAPVSPTKNNDGEYDNTTL